MNLLKDIKKKKRPSPPHQEISENKNSSDVAHPLQFSMLQSLEVDQA